jgi:hypothetical protein
MKQVKMQKIPKCDFCDQPAKYDAPTIGGPWANMCPVHYKKNGHPHSSGLGSILIQAPKQQPKQDKVVVGIEDTSIETLEAVMMDSQNREIECPECGSGKDVEPDANYIYTCECGVKVQVPTPYC